MNCSGVRQREKTIARTVGGATTTNRDLAFLRAAFNWAIRTGAVTRTPFKLNGQNMVQLGAGTKRTRRLDEGEADKLLAACGTHLRVLVEAALETGCRQGELLSLQWSQVRVNARGQAELFLPRQ